MSPRPNPPLSLEPASQRIAEFIEDYNAIRLNSAIGYGRPKTAGKASAKKFLKTAIKSLKQREKDANSNNQNNWP